MKIRAARATDAFSLVEIVTERHAETRYAGEVDVDLAYARKMFAAAVQRHGGSHEGATFLQVATQDGRVQAFVLGQLARVYLVGDRLAASDLMLLGRKDTPRSVLTRLFDSYVEWALSIPKVFEIGGSWSDAIAGSEVFDAVLRRKGFEPCGTVYRMTAQREAERIAA